MKEDKQPQEKKIDIRDLTRKQIKELRAAGLDPAFVEMDAQHTSDMVDWIAEKIYPDIDFEELPYRVLLDVAMKTYRTAIGQSEAAKN